MKYYKSSYITIGLFILAIAVTAFVAVKVEPDEYEMVRGSIRKVNKVSKLKTVDFYLSESLRPIIYLQSTDVDITNNNNLDFVSPHGYSMTNNEKVFYKGNSGFANVEKQSLVLNGDVKFTKGKSIYLSNSTKYNYKTGDMKSIKKVYVEHFIPGSKDTIQINADENRGNILSKVSRFSGHVNGELIRHRPYEEGFKFKSDLLTLDMVDQVVYFDKNLKFYRQSMYIQADRGEVYLDNYNKKLKYYVLYDDIILEEKVTSNNKKFIRKAVSQKLEGLEAGNRIVLSGAPIVTQEGDTIKGNEIVLRRNVELIEVEDSSTTFKVKNR